MKHHQPFRTALLVSIQERREQFPEMTDGDIAQALRIIGGQFQSRATRQRQAERKRRFDELLLQAELARKAQQHEPEEVRIQRQAKEREAREQQYRAEAVQRAAESLKRAEARQKEAEERAAQRKLSLEIANAGYRAIATKHHPDKGGSQETMARLNRARDHLKRMA